MPAILLTPPASEPLILADAKNYLRVAHSEDDALIQSMIAAARVQVETHTRRALITQTWRIVLERWPASARIVPPVFPLRSLIAARVFNAAGDAETLDEEIFISDSASGVIAFDAGRVTQPGRALAGIELDIEAGYGAPGDVPAPLVQAVRLLLARAYEYRGRTERNDTVPEEIAALLAPYRVVSL